MVILMEKVIITTMVLTYARGMWMACWRACASAGACLGRGL